MNFIRITNIEELIKKSEKINDIESQIEKNYDSIKESVLDIEKEYFNELKQQEIGNLLGKKIILVDGDVVEKNINMDFVEGTNYMADDYVPDDTIWVDVNLDSDSFKYIIMHEFIESMLMEKYHLDYNEAHNIANKFEKRFREESENNWR